MQDIHRCGCDWDDAAPTTLLDVWTSWAKDNAAISNLQIQRCVRRKAVATSFELHACTDASTVWFSACVYIRSLYGDDQFSVSLVKAKSRVALLRQMSVPRLELHGALLGARLCETVILELGTIFIRAIFWCDSETVLQWIHSKKCRYQPSSPIELMKSPKRARQVSGVTSLAPSTPPMTTQGVFR